MLLRRLAPEHKFATAAKLCGEVLAGFAEGTYTLTGASEVLRDTLCILSWQEIKVSCYPSIVRVVQASSLGLERLYPRSPGMCLKHMHTRFFNTWFLSALQVWKLYKCYLCLVWALHYLCALERTHCCGLMIVCRHTKSVSVCRSTQADPHLRTMMNLPAKLQQLEQQRGV